MRIKTRAIMRIPKDCLVTLKPEVRVRSTRHHRKSEPCLVPNLSSLSFLCPYFSGPCRQREMEIADDDPRAAAAAAAVALRETG